MGYTRPTTYVPGVFLRQCDLCGVRYRSNELVRGEDGFWRCTKYCVEVPQITRDKISAESQRRREAPPAPYAMGYDTRETFAAEEAVFSFLANMPNNQTSVTGGLGAAPFGTWQVTSGIGNPVSTQGAFIPAGETIRYLYNIIVEAKRPSSWLSRATAKLQQLADLCIANQIGIGTFTGFTQSNAYQWGAVNVANSFQVQSTAQAGLGFLYAYRILGANKYIVSARAAASYLRNVQSAGSFFVSGFPSTDAGGTIRLYTGGLHNNGNQAPGTFVYDGSTMVGLEFWRELLSTDGDQQIGCTGTASGIFTGPPQQLLSQSIADMRAFWAVGTFDVATGTTLTGLSATTPKEKFNAYPFGSGSWEYSDGVFGVGTSITGANVALALRSLYQYEGFSAQVSAVYKWLMGFSSNAAFQSPANTLATDYACASTTLSANPPVPLPIDGNVVPKSYDPTLALTTTLKVTSNPPINGSSLYDWQTTGCLAAIHSSQNANAFRNAKKQMCAGRTRMPVTFSDQAAGPVADWLMLRGTSGLAFQLGQADSGSVQQWNTASAARAGAVFRFQPQAWTGGNPAQLQPNVGAG